MTNLEELKALALAATPVWECDVWCSDEDARWAAVGPRHKQRDPDLDPDSPAGRKAQKDSDYIAAANPQTILSLIEQVEAYENALKLLRYTEYWPKAREVLARFNDAPNEP
jgi:hypothetical protein